MTTHPTSINARERRALRTIGVLKLLKATAMLVVGCGLLGLTGGHADQLQHWLHQLRPGLVVNQIDRWLKTLLALPVGWRRVLDFGAFLYAALFAIEGIGLLLEKRWAEWMTIVTTGLLIPFECFEIYERPTALLRIVILILNVAILIYLIRQVRTDHAVQKAD